MANVAVVKPQVSQGFSRRRGPRRLAAVLGRIERGFTAWRAGYRRFRTESEIRRKLGDVDDHLLRDIGLVRTNGRIESIDIQRCLGYRRDL